MVTMEMEDIEVKPVSRRGLMMLEVSARMNESQMHEAVEAFKEYITGETWGRWLEEWNKEAKEEKEERQYEFE